MAWACRRYYARTVRANDGGMAMSLDEIGGAAAKTRRRANSKAADLHSAKRLKCTISLSPQASQRLGVHASMTGKDRSEVVETLINQHLRRYVVSDRGSPESQKAGISESEE